MRSAIAGHTGPVDALKAAGKTSGDIVTINGSPDDANAAGISQGGERTASPDSSGYRSLREVDT